MRARHRHFRYKAAGANAAYDSRYLTDSDGTSLETWSSLSSTNDATQASSGKRPVVKSGVNGINGMTALAFDGSDDELQLASTTGMDAVNQSWVVVGKRDNSAGRTEVLLSVGNTTDGNGLSLLPKWIDDNNYSCVGYVSNRAIFATAINNNSFIASATGGSTQKAYVGGTLGTTGTSQSTSNFSVTGGGYLGSGRAITALIRYYDGLIGLVAIYSQVLADPLRKRLEHAAAFSFKISCN
jgi:hypothetical protein